MGRSLVVVSTLVGGAGLGLAVAYVMLVVVAFLPGGERVAEFMVGSVDGTPGYGYALIVVPYALLLLHLWLRVNVARVLVDLGEHDVARQYAAKRLKVGLLRGRREGLANRTALMRLACRQRNYDEVEALAKEAKLPRRGLFTSVAVEAAHHRWRLEGALRREDLVTARQTVDSAWPIAGQGDDVADFCAAAAELAVRNGDLEAYQQWHARAEFATPDRHRTSISALFAAHRFELGASDELLERVRADAASWLDDVPGAGLELALALDEPLADAQEQWGERADRRSKHVMERRKAAADPH